MLATLSASTTRIMSSLASDDIAMVIPVLGIVGSIFVATVYMITNAIKSNSARKQYEESRREIAAYVAEGSITPDDAERLLKTQPTDAENSTKCG